MSINLNGIGTNFPNPGIYVQINFAAGPSTGSNAAKVVILIGNGTSSATATEGVVYGPTTAVTMASESDAITLFGQGSQLHTMYWRFTSLNPSNIVYATMVASSGGAAATGTITLSTTSTANMTLRVWVEDQSVDVPIISGDTVTTAAARAITYINGNIRWPVVATNSSGVITLTCNVIGPEGNALFYQAAIIGGNGSMTTSATANAAMTGGTTADTVANALAAINSSQFDYYILGDSDFGLSSGYAAANVGRVSTQITNMAQPTVGIRQRAIFGSQDSSAHTIARSQATGINNPRLEFVWGTCTDLLPSSLAATLGAIYVLFETSGPLPINRCNFSQFPVSANDQNFWNVLPSRSGPSVFPTMTVVTSCLNGGVSALQVTRGTNVHLSKRVTSYSVLPGTSNPDYRCRDGHIPSVCDAYAAAEAQSTAEQFSGYNLANDPATGQPVPPNCITPGMWEADINTTTQLFEGYGLTVNANQSIAGTQVQASGDRLSAIVPLQVIPIADQFCLLVTQV